MNYKRANKEMQQATLKILQERTDIRNVQDRSQTLLAQAAFIADDAALSASVVWNGARESSAPATSISGSTNEPQTREQQLEAEVQRLKTQLAAATPRDSSSATKSPAAQQKEGPPKLERSGTWVQVGDRRISKASWDALQQALHCWTASGSWKKDTDGVDAATGLPRMWLSDPYSACGTPLQRAGLDWIWQPDPPASEVEVCGGAPPLRYRLGAQWSAEVACEALRGRPLVMCGDGIQTSVYETLASVLGAPGGGKCGTFGQGCRNTACNGKVELRHIEDVRCPADKVIPILETLPNAVYITNRGHHYSEDAEVRADVLKQLQVLRLRALNITWIWRNHHMYHAPTEGLHHTGPVAEWKGGFAQHPRHPEWRWGDFPKQGEVVREVVTAQAGALFIDMLPALMLRPDGHVPTGDDAGLYYCIPGPFDLFPVFLLNTLVFIEDSYKRDSSMLR